MENSTPHGPYKFNVSASDIYKATKLALPELFDIGMKSMCNDIWNASIEGPNQEKQQILERGGWLVDFKTGKQTSLEEKI